MKNDCFLKKAKQTQRRCNRCCVECIRGLIPKRSVVVRDEEGNTCKTLEQQQEMENALH